MNFTAKKICYVAVFTAMNVMLSSFGITVPGGHIYLNDIVICFAALVLDPFSAFIVGGVGAFFGDLIFYPTPMFVSLFTHGLQGVAISLIVGKKTSLKPVRRVLIALFTGIIIMVGGYTLGKTFVYSTWETAVIKLPYEFAQAGIGAVVAFILYYKTPLPSFIFKKLPEEEK
ncbi:MAG TPA: ECF transporter S component [Clostridiales bacterium]|nr:ECF transporter S component [Clostridiales bacterium]